MCSLSLGSSATLSRSRAYIKFLPDYFRFRDRCLCLPSEFRCFRRFHGMLCIWFPIHLLFMALHTDADRALDHVCDVVLRFFGFSDQKGLNIRSMRWSAALFMRRAITVRFSVCVLLLLFGSQFRIRDETRYGWFFFGSGDGLVQM